MAIIRFGANGFRARFDEGFGSDAVVRSADALGRLWAQGHSGATVMVGYDTRHDGARLALLMGQVLASHGLVAKVAQEPCPTPALGWCAAHDPSCIGAVMLSASEAPCEYGGILLRGHDGGSVSTAFLAALDREVPPDPTPARGEALLADFITPYIEGLATEVDAAAIAASGLKVVADTMHGASGEAVRRLFQLLGCDVSYLHLQQREDFGGLHPLPAEPWVDECEQAVLQQGASCAIVLDGDGDRAALVDERGHLISRHDLVPLVVSHLVKGRGQHGRVVMTTATSSRLRRQAEQLDCDYTVVPVGFERIYDEAVEGDVLLGTEEYGGVCVPGHLMERDGLYACLLALELMAESGRPLSALVEEQSHALGTLYYGRKDMRIDTVQMQILSNLLPGLNPHTLAGMRPVGVSHTDGTGLEFEDGSWVLARVSRTDTVLRVYAEAPSARKRDLLLNRMVEIVRARL